MDNPYTCDGTLSQDDFLVAARALSERWKEVNTTLPRWTWVPHQTIGGSSGADGFLSLENVYHLQLNEADDQQLFWERSHCKEDVLADSATLVQNHNEKFHIYDFHVLYSFSFRVPVLYFRGFQSDGQPLEANDIEKDLPLYSSKTMRDSKWTFLTQEEHPFLRRPWFMLHPCGTSDWMKLLLHRRTPTEGPDVQQYLVSWLSVVGQAVGLRIPLELQNKSPSNSSDLMPSL